MTPHVVFQASPRVRELVYLPSQIANGEIRPIRLDDQVRTKRGEDFQDVGLFEHGPLIARFSESAVYSSSPSLATMCSSSEICQPSNQSFFGIEDGQSPRTGIAACSDTAFAVDDSGDVCQNSRATRQRQRFGSRKERRCAEKRKIAVSTTATRCLPIDQMTSARDECLPAGTQAFVHDEITAFRFAIRDSARDRQSRKPQPRQVFES